MEGVEGDFHVIIVIEAGIPVLPELPDFTDESKETHLFNGSAIPRCAIGTVGGATDLDFAFH